MMIIIWVFELTGSRVSACIKVSCYWLSWLLLKIYIFIYDTIFTYTRADNTCICLKHTVYKKSDST